VNQEIELLVFKAYHGELSDAERNLLTQWAAASPANARQLVECSVNSNSIGIALRGRRVVRSASANEMAGLGLRTKERAIGKSKLISLHRSLAALLVITSLVAVAALLGWGQQTLENHEHVSFGVTSTVGLTDVQVLVSTDLKWNRFTDYRDDSETIVIPESGYLYHEFLGGGFILLEGPTTYQLEENNFTIRLVEGRMVAKADPLEPFTILVDGNRIKAEGAEFGVQRKGDEVASAIIFDGSVEVKQDPSEDQTSVTIVKAGQIVALGPHVDQGNQLARATQADSSEYERLIDSVKLRPSHMSNSLQFLADAPESLLSGDLADYNHVRMFCERAGVSVEVGELAQIGNGVTDLGEVPTNLLVDSYILHFDPQVKGTLVETTGMIIFDRPIHAVLGSTSAIQSTDALFGAPGTVYPRTSRSAGDGTAGWGIEYYKDCVKLEDDGKTLLFRLGANQDIDQIRILVEARSPTQLSE